MGWLGPGLAPLAPLELFFPAPPKKKGRAATDRGRSGEPSRFASSSARPEGPALTVPRAPGKSEQRGRKGEGDSAGGGDRSWRSGPAQTRPELGLPATPSASEARQRWSSQLKPVFLSIPQPRDLREIAIRESSEESRVCMLYESQVTNQPRNVLPVQLPGRKVLHQQANMIPVVWMHSN